MFSNAIRMMARGNRVQCEVLCELQFLSGPMYVHNGGGILQTRDFDGEIEDVEWLGLQGRAQISGLGSSRMGESRSVTCSLNLDDQTIRDWFFESEQRAVKGRKFRFWGQFYDADCKPVDAKFHIYTGIGDRLRMSKSGPQSRSLSLMLEDMVARRRRSANQMVTHADQQLRDPGSTGFIYVPKMVDKTLNLFDAKN
jgi:hypothetical protein